ncbi:hypothetical protein BDK61_2643 [Haloarcula quadrata]|uniref:Uncharacterized protein n=1 Tax=Haloarcula quadrata TaxID=182779 RepID=A0A495R7X0_9EURY|nr:hypothetical protein [Haloarcula quadrata]RKS83300.1 hypothetical protein BDK61_2643 [Haloarcula quadrata]
MTYVYDCDGWCDDDIHDERPALTGEFNEEFYKSTAIGGRLSEQGYDLGDLVTLCGPCVERLLIEADV